MFSSYCRGSCCVVRHWLGVHVPTFVLGVGVGLHFFRKQVVLNWVSLRRLHVLFLFFLVYHVKYFFLCIELLTYVFRKLQSLLVLLKIQVFLYVWCIWCLQNRGPFYHVVFIYIVIIVVCRSPYFVEIGLIKCKFSSDQFSICQVVDNEANCVSATFV